MLYEGLRLFVEGSGLRVEGVRFRVETGRMRGFRLLDLTLQLFCLPQGYGVRVKALGLRVKSIEYGLRAYGIGYRV